MSSRGFGTLCKVLWLLIVLPALTNCANDLGVVPGSIETLTSSSPHQSLAKKWSIRSWTPHGADNTASENASVHLAIAVPTVVSVHQMQQDDPNVVASVEFSGDSEELLERIEVVVKDNAIDVRLRLEPQPGKVLHLQGFLIGTIHLSSEYPLSDLTADADTSVVIQKENVFQSTSNPSIDLVLRAKDDARLFVSAIEFHVNSLQLHASSDSWLQLDLPALITNRDAVIEGSGDSQVVLNTGRFIVDGAIRNQLTGTSSICAVASKAFSVQRQLSVSSTGLSKTTLIGGQQGQTVCPQLNIDAVGEAKVDLADVSCTNATLHVTGRPTIVVNVSDTLVVDGLSKGNVYYVGAKPNVINSNDDSPAPPMMSADESMVRDTTQCSLKALPALEPQRLELLVANGSSVSASSLSGFITSKSNALLGSRVLWLFAMFMVTLAL